MATRKRPATQLETLLAELRTLAERIAAAEAGTDARATKRVRLALDAVTKTFRYLDEEELARQKKAAADAKKGGKK